MLTIKVQSSKKAAEKYMEDHLSTGNQYSEGEDLSARQKPTTETPVKYYHDDQMRWHGSLVEKLGLDPEKPITKDQFSVLLENKNPTTSTQLTAKTIVGRRLYFDATFSAPKSVSIMAITMNDQALIKAHDLATQETLKELELSSQTRIRVNGANDLRKTGSILVASVVHATSRANDPQLHSHNLVFNVTWDQIEKKFKALEASEIYKKTNYFTEVYRNKLAEKVIALGYEIEPQKHGWEIKGVSPEIRATFSKRSKSISQLAKELEVSLNRPLTNNEKSTLTHQTRKKKTKSLQIKEIVHQHKNELKIGELSDLNKLKNRALAKRIEIHNPVKNGFTPHQKLKLEVAYKFAKDHLFERRSVVQKDDLKLLTLKQVYGEVKMQDIDQLIDKDDEIFVGENETIGSIKGLAKEVYINDFVDQTMNKFSEKLVHANFDIGTLRDDQKKAFHEILNNKDQVQILEGPAGTGKSYLLKKIIQVLDQNQVKAIAVAPTTGATQNLSKDLSISAQTLQSFLTNYEKILELKSDGVYPKKFLIVDEAGLVSVDQMENLLKVSEKTNLQILLVGDTRQHNSIEAGDALRSLQKFSKAKVSTLNKVVRQKNEMYGQIVDYARKGYHEEALKMLSKSNCIKNNKIPNLDIINQITSEVEIKNAFNDCHILNSYFDKSKATHSVLIITPTRHELQQITDLIRLKKYYDYNGPIVKKEVIQSLRFTSAEKENLNSYQIEKSNPMYLNFHLKHKSFNKDSQWQVLDNRKNKLYVKNVKNNKMCSLDLSKLESKSFDVIQKKELEIKINEKLIIQKNDKLNGFVNGDIVQVKDIIHNEIILTDGRKISENLNFLDYGYVTTSYSSQGKTCDYVLLSMSNFSGNALSSEQFYVSLSRAKEGAEIFVEDVEYIKAQLQRSRSRQLNKEILSPAINEKIKSHIGIDMNQLKSQLDTLVNFKKIDQHKTYFEKFKERFKDFIDTFNKNRTLDHITAKNQSLSQSIQPTPSFKSLAATVKKSIELDI